MNYVDDARTIPPAVAERMEGGRELVRARRHNQQAMKLIRAENPELYHGKGSYVVVDGVVSCDIDDKWGDAR